MGQQHGAGKKKCKKKRDFCVQLCPDSVCLLSLFAHSCSLSCLLLSLLLLVKLVPFHWLWYHYVFVFFYFSLTWIWSIKKKKKILSELIIQQSWGNSGLRSFVLHQRYRNYNLCGRGFFLNITGANMWIESLCCYLSVFLANWLHSLKMTSNANFFDFFFGWRSSFFFWNLLNAQLIQSNIKAWGCVFNGSSVSDLSDAEFW